MCACMCADGLVKLLPDRVCYLLRAGFIQGLAITGTAAAAVAMCPSVLCVAFKLFVHSTSGQPSGVVLSIRCNNNSHTSGFERVLDWSEWHSLLHGNFFLALSAVPRRRHLKLDFFRMCVDGPDGSPAPTPDVLAAWLHALQDAQCYTRLS